MALLRSLVRNDSGAAAAEMILVTPMLLILMFGSVELGNYFMTEHAVIKQVRDGSRYASRLTIAEAYTCSAGSDLSTIFEDGDASTKIINVTKTGSVDGTAAGRFGSAFWAACPGSAAPVTVSVRCVNKANYAGIYSTLDGNIPVVKVSADVSYPSLFGALGFNTSGLCIHADSEGAVYGL
jgi:Flp pilus assembly protein TadG